MTELWYRLNFLGEENFFEMRNLIDGIIVPAHLLAYYEIAIPKFLSSLGLPILIDPMTYVWGIDPQYISKDGELKKSYQKLIEKLNCRVANILGNDRIQKIDEVSSEFKEFVDNILRFQLLCGDVKETPRRSSLERIRRYREKVEPEEPSRIRPFALVPPYFYFSTTLGQSYQKTVYAARLAEDFNKNTEKRIWPCLCMDKSLLADEDQLNKIIEDFKDYSEIILWINNFDETKAYTHELSGFVKLISKFAEEKTNVINLYGGYFSLLLNHMGLSRLSCGICYSNRKGVFEEVGGGGLPIRYYEPHLKIKLLADDMFQLCLDIPELLSCNCPICLDYSEKYRTIQRREDKEKKLNEFFGVLGKGGKMVKKGIINWEKSRLHFLHARKAEQTFTNKSTLNEIVSDLRGKYELMRKNHLDPNKYRFESFEYLRLWADSLEGNQ